MVISLMVSVGLCKSLVVDDELFRLALWVSLVVEGMWFVGVGCTDNFTTYLKTPKLRIKLRI